MEEEIKKCYELVTQMPKVSVKRFDELLKSKSTEAHEEFIKGFLKYIFSITYRVYCLNKDDFNAYYSYEDFFNDGIILATRLYNYMDYNKRKDNYCFSNFCNYYHYLIIHELANTCCLRADYKTINRIKLIIKTRQKLFEEKKCEPPIEEIMQLTGLSEKVIGKACAYDDFEKIYAQKMIYDENLATAETRCDILRAMNEISKGEQEVLCQINGLRFDGEPYFPATISEVARYKEQSRQSVWEKSNRGYQKLRKSLHLTGYDK